MNYKKILGLILLILFSMISVNAITTLNNSAYYNWDNNLDDVTGNGFNLANFGATLNNTGKINQAYDYDGTDYMKKVTAPALTGSFSIGSWIFLAEESDANNKEIVMSRDLVATSNLNYHFYILNTNDFVTLGWYDGGWQNCIGVTNLVSNTWYHVGATFNDTNNSVSIYINGVEDKTCTGLTGTPTTAGSQDLFIGSDRGSAQFFSGTIDELTIFNRGLELQDYIDLYNGGTGLTYPYTPESAPPITNNITSVYDTNNISIQLNTTTNVNMSYVLNSAIETSICNNCNNSVLNITGVEGVNNITLISLDNNGQTNTTDNFTIDTIFPTITNNLLNLTSYDFISNFSCSDINIVSCNISIDGFNKNSSINFTLNHNGNLNYTIFSTDFAGNKINETGIISINPYQYFSFYDTARALNIINYTFGNYNSSGQYANIPLYDLGLGTHSLQFSKFGYTQDNFQFNFNLTSALNQTFNSTPVTITLQVFDEKSPSTQLNFNLSLNNVSNYTQYLNQLNFQKYYNETLTGNLTLTLESSGFSLRKVFTELSPYSAVSHVIYLLSDVDSTPVIFRTLNLAQTQAISDVVFTFKKEINGVPTFLGQAKTDSQGYTFFNMDVLSSYEITISKNGYISQIINSIPGKTDYVILMQESGTTNSYLYDDFSYLITPSSISSFPFNVSTTVFDQANLISSMRFTVTGDNTSFTNILTASSGGSIQFEITNQSSQYILNLSVMREGKEYNYINKLNYYPTTATNTTVNKVATQLKGTSNNEDRVFMMIILYIVAIVLGSIFSPAAGAVMGLLPITIYSYVGWISVGIAALFYLITILGVLYFER